MGDLILNRYQLGDFVGKGGAGTVTVAYDTRIQREVAIKRIPLPKNVQIVENSYPGIDEARRAASVKHPNIVSIIDIDHDDTYAYLIMEYVNGKSLGTLLHEEVALTVSETSAIAHAVSDALIFAHNNGVLHLDIKPDNILIDKNGNVKVADFGLAALQDAWGRSMAKGGSIGYMPPEQIKTHNVDVRTDEWALAIVIYECITGQNPFIAPTMKESLDKMENMPIINASAVQPQLDSYIDSVLLDAIHTNPDYRYDTVEEFAAELLPLLGRADKGTRSLRQLLNETEEAPEATGTLFDEDGKLNLWIGLTAKKRELIGRCVAAPCAMLLAWLGFSSLDASLVVQIVIALFVGGAACALPTVGAMLGVISLVAGLCMNGAWIPATILLCLACVWWLFMGRHAIADSNCGVFSPLVGLVSMPSISPLICGFTLSPVRAIAAAAFNGILAFTCMCTTASATLFGCNLSVAPTSLHSINDYFIAYCGFAPVIYLVALVASAWVMSIMCHSSRKSFAIIGALLASALMYGGFLLAALVAPEGTIWLTDNARLIALITCIASFVIMCVVIFFGAPLHIENRKDR